MARQNAHSASQVLLLGSAVCWLVIAVAACSARTASPQEAQRIPFGWIDLPEAPFRAVLVGPKALLLNRTDNSFNTLMTGCVVEEGGRVRVVGKLFVHDVFDSAYGPGATVEGPLAMLDRLDWYVANSERVTGRTDGITRCPDGSNMALISAGLRGGPQWSAEGGRWPGK